MKVLWLKGITVSDVLVMAKISCNGQKQKHTFINSHEWPKQNFSIQFHYNIKQTSDENEENINLEIISWSNTKFSKLTSWEVL